jgi:hypothetical protein
MGNFVFVQRKTKQRQHESCFCLGVGFTAVTGGPLDL